jgi:hypothetical protein
MKIRFVIEVAGFRSNKILVSKLEYDQFDYDHSTYNASFSNNKALGESPINSLPEARIIFISATRA